jgi:hypothetical protein
MSGIGKRLVVGVAFLALMCVLACLMVPAFILWLVLGALWWLASGLWPDLGVAVETPPVVWVLNLMDRLVSW